MKNVTFSLGVFFFLTSLLAAQNPKGTILALSKRDRTLAIVDPATLKVIAKAPVGNDPHEVIASTDGKIAYSSTYGFGAYNTLAVIDLVNHKALPSIDLGALRGPHGLTYVAGKVWFTAEGAKAFGSYDPASGKVDFIFGTGQNRTHMIYVSEDQKRIITTNVSSGTVSIIDAVPPRQIPSRGAAPPAHGDWEQTVIRVGNGSEGFDVSPDGKQIWVANAQDGTISIIDAAEKKVIDTLAANARGANRLKFTPDGKLVFVSTLFNGDLIILDAATRKEVKRIKVGHGAAGILMQPDGSRAFVACTPDNYVAVIGLKSLEVMGHFEVGQEPDGLAWATVR
ncbi:MAG TPA: cytochrome D1 domain-containing protein [Candidatus Sulfotelmatobacter sp.]|nr:cytochrome D1 domain-containing protein [Candidatus Sulfotelmatobacter sp.]